MLVDHRYTNADIGPCREGTHLNIFPTSKHSNTYINPTQSATMALTPDNWKISIFYAHETSKIVEYEMIFLSIGELTLFSIRSSTETKPVQTRQTHYLLSD